MSSNITLAVFCAARKAEAKPLYQYDYGQVLKIEGVSLPSAYEVHFGNAAEGGITKISIGDESGVVIPDEYLTSGADIWAFVYLHTGEDDGETEYVVHIPVRKRPEPSDIEPTPEQQDVITQTIAALNVAVEGVDARADEIEEMIEEYGGVPGPKGDPGISPTVTTQTVAGGTLIIITDASGAHQFLVLNGAKGDKGDNGADGNKIFVGNQVTYEGQSVPPGTTEGDIYINNETYNVYRWLAVGAWVLVGNIKGAPGASGADGVDGQDGHTPVRGVDYWTAADQAAIVADVLAALPTAEGGAY